MTCHPLRGALVNAAKLEALLLTWQNAREEEAMLQGDTQETVSRNDDTVSVQETLARANAI